MPSGDPQVILMPEKSELEKFARSFHQDWDIEGIDFFEGARRYSLRLSSERRINLCGQLYNFIKNNIGTPPAELKRRWFKLGSDAGWQPKVDIHVGLKEFYLILSGKEYK
jgi:hypothetical protein